MLRLFAISLCCERLVSRKISLKLISLQVVYPPCLCLQERESVCQFPYKYSSCETLKHLWVQVTRDVNAINWRGRRVWNSEHLSICNQVLRHKNTQMTMGMQKFIRSEHLTFRPSIMRQLQLILYNITVCNFFKPLRSSSHPCPQKSHTRQLNHV